MPWLRKAARMCGVNDTDSRLENAEPKVSESSSRTRLPMYIGAINRIVTGPLPRHHDDETTQILSPVRLDPYLLDRRSVAAEASLRSKTIVRIG